jgi:hypothetical protein
MAVGHDGSVWISGVTAGQYRIIRVLEKRDDGTCPEGAPLTAPSNYCFREYAGGQQRLLRLLVVDRGAAGVFDPGTGASTPGVLGLTQDARCASSALRPTTRRACSSPAGPAGA